jgi:hypothetical protein
MSEKQLRESKLAGLKARKNELSLKIRADIRTIQQKLATASVDKLQDVDIPNAAASMSQATGAYYEFIEILRQIETLEREL